MALLDLLGHTDFGLLSALGAWYHFRRAEWMRAAAWVLVAGFSRPIGFMLSVALGLLALGVADARSAGSPDQPPPRLRRSAAALAKAEGLRYGCIMYP